MLKSLLAKLYVSLTYIITLILIYAVYCTIVRAIIINFTSFNSGYESFFILISGLFIVPFVVVKFYKPPLKTILHDSQRR